MTTPVAFAVPAEADRMVAVVDAALTDSRLGEADELDRHEPDAAPGVSGPPAFFDANTIAAAGAFLLAACAGGYWLSQRSRRR